MKFQWSKNKLTNVAYFIHAQSCFEIVKEFEINLRIMIRDYEVC